MGTGPDWGCSSGDPHAEGDGILRPVEEGGRSLLPGEDLVLLPLALAVGHVHSWSPKDEEDVLHRREATGVSVTTVLLGLAILLLTQNVHLVPSTQQAEQAGFTRAENHETCQSIFPEN
jgi:hypothetical protein